MMKRWATALLALCMLLTGALPACAAGLTKAEKYDAALDELRRYFTGEATMTLEEMSAVFDELDSFRHSVSFSLYAKVLRDAEAEVFTDAYLWLTQIRRNEAFCAYVADEENALAPVNAVESYVLARQAQSEGRTDEAIACYSECITLLDSNARLNALEMQLLEDKYQQALTLMADGTQESLQAAIALWEELAALHYRDSAQRLEAAQNPTRATLPNGHTIQLALSQYRFTGPGAVSVTITIRNDSDTDAPGPIALYDPSGRRITDFGTPTLVAGEATSWSGTWSVTQEQLNAGRIVFAAACVLPDENGALTTQFTPFYGAIGYADSMLPENAYVDAFGETVWETEPTATPEVTAPPTVEESFPSVTWNMDGSMTVKTQIAEVTVTLDESDAITTLKAIVNETEIVQIVTSAFIGKTIPVDASTIPLDDSGIMQAIIDALEILDMPQDADS